MKRSLVTVLVIIAVVLALGIAGVLGYVWYKNNHVFVDGDAYPVDTGSLDLREEDVSFAYYHSLKEQLPNCNVLWNVPFQGSRFASDTRQLTVSALTEEDIAVMEQYFPNLQSVDATACHNYDMLEMLMERIPGLKVDYAVSLGGQSYAPAIRDIVLSEGDYDFVTLMENLAYLHELTAVIIKLHHFLNLF